MEEVQTTDAREEEEYLPTPAVKATIDHRVATLHDRSRAIVQESEISKDTALAIMELFHDMESVIVDVRHEAERGMSGLQSRVDTMSLRESHALFVEQKEDELNQLKTVLQQHQVALQAQSSKKR